MKIAIIGTGISGLGAAYLLHPHHEITIYEKNNYIGGHSRTIQIDDNGTKTPVDTGFIVFNHKNYFHLTRLFESIGVKTEKSDMSFGVSIKNNWLEYGSKGMFSQKRNLFRPGFWKMVFDIIRFNKTALTYLEKNNDATLEECLDDLKMGEWFKKYYLQAMGAAIWSCSITTILKYPAKTFIQFFKNHGLLSINKHPQWYTVSGGSKEYVSLLTEPFVDKIKLGCGAKKVTRNDIGATVFDTEGSKQKYDAVIFACHADEALKLIEKPTEEEKQILEKFKYQKNKVVVHKDISFMPKERKCWASWVYLSESLNDKNESVSLSYWMNNLQNLDTKNPILVTLNPGKQPPKELTYDEHEFMHPIFTKEAIAAQSEIKEIQGKNKFWFCGAYQKYGFHEDGLSSSVEIAKSMDVEIPWE
jgi:predicted NAD/FAD-binding protein